MRVAIPLFGDLVAPRFGFFDEMVVAAVVDGAVVERLIARPKSGGVHERLVELAELEVEVILCGGFNRCFLPMAEALGIRVVPGLAGKADELLVRFVAGEELLPACGCRFRGRKGAGCAGRRTKREERK